MMIHEITPDAGRHKRRKRVGRGPGSGHGKTCGRGHNGAGSRSGYKRRPGYEGGQVPLYVRFPKRGFSNARFKTHYALVNVQAIADRFDDGAEVNPDLLVKVGLIRSTVLPVKVLGDGELTKKLQITAAAFSESAKQKIESAGGSAKADR
jgi:large subunit ribosomal protein L15